MFKKAVMTGFLLSFLVFGACASTKNYGTSQLFDLNTMKKIVINESTMDDVRSLLGKPMKIVNYPPQSPTKSIWVYDARTYQTVLGFAKNGQEKSVSIAFSQDGIVRSMNSTQTDPLQDQNQGM